MSAVLALSTPVLRAAPAELQKANAAPAQSQVTVSALVVDKYSGQPARDTALRLQTAPYSGGSVYDAVTDAEGRISFANVPPGEYYVAMKGKTETIGYKVLPGEKGGWADWLKVKVPPADIGTLRIPWPTWVDANLAPVCATGRVPRVNPAADVVFLQKLGDTWGLDTRWQSNEREWGRTWKAVVCLDDDQKLVGRYVTKSGQSAGGAYKETIKAKVIRLDNGKEYKTKVSGQPPSSVSTKYGATGGHGSAGPELARWLKDGLPR